MSILSTAWSQEEIYYIVERAYGLYRQGRLREAAILFAGVRIADPENAYCEDALSAIRSMLGQRQLPTHLPR
ncbi:MAG TPA: hypothetical protein VH477_09445 [Bryobacteraceae bacterium]|jgi:hypothetical protein